MQKNLAGITFSFIIAFFAIYISEITFIKNIFHLNAFIIAIVLGFIFSNIMEIPEIFKDGITFTLKKLLRLAIILLGFKISLMEISEVGLKGLFVIAISVSTCFLFTIWLGKKMGVEKKLTLLLASGTSICGASAIIATSGVIKADDKDSAISVAVISIMGTIFMILYPLIFHTFGLSENLYAVWTGSSIHEVAQVVGTGFSVNDQTGKLASLVKMSRVTFIVPITLILLFLELKKIKAEQKSMVKLKDLNIPWFVLMFIGIILFNSLKIVPDDLVKKIITFDNLLLTSAMFCMGLGINFSKIKSAGMKPIYLGLAISLQISLVAFLASFVLL